ncbi:MFS general substrate transporter [Penicillium malachiteum]|uniref:MFS general substrate transporter n=1 Tax=Penicillium malachiteum TaxID=1324776 RepID=UPI00254858A4|nr:MFS general substrate transporter [Penicillium malachiteum]KAJ5715361.1 MFS general substrate transporter [Penicillium malachiteum]
MDRTEYPWGYRWRSSSAFIISTCILALFTETFLYSFIVPIVSYMIESRLHLPSSRTQRYTTALLTTHGFFSILSPPIVAHFADKTPDRKVPLILCLVFCTIGTCLVAFTPSVWALFLGRILQSIAGSAGWIVAFSTLSDNIAQEHMGKTMGLAMSFVSAGIMSGPTVSGALVEIAGYWAAWAVPFCLLSIDLAARLIMLERPRVGKQKDRSIAQQQDEAPLLPSEPSTVGSEMANSRGFYCIILSDGRAVVGLLNTFLFSAMLSAFDSTLPLHLRDVFNWGSLQAGLVFLTIQLPGPFLSPLVGWLRDRVGIRYPTTVGWIVVSLLLWTLTIPGKRGFEWASPDWAGKQMFVATTIGFGMTIPFVRGVALLQLMSEYIVSPEISAKNPSIFGPHGATSKVFSSVEIAFNVGTTVGPLAAGSLTEALGFTYTNSILATVALSVGVFSFTFFDHKPSAGEGDPNQKDPV